MLRSISPPSAAVTPSGAALAAAFAAIAFTATGCSAPPANTPPATASVHVTADAPKPEPGASIFWRRRIDGSGNLLAPLFVTNAAGEMAFVEADRKVFRFDAQRKPMFEVVLDGGNFYLTDVALDTGGNTYLTGTFTSNVTLERRVILRQNEERSGSSGFLVKVSSDGKVADAVELGGDINGPALLMTPKGEPVVAGAFNGEVQIRATFLGDGMEGLFVAQFDARGDVGWSRHIIGSGTVRRAAIDSAGSIFIAGEMYGPVGFDPQSPLRPGPSSGSDTYFAKLDSTGRSVWARHVAAERIAPAPDGSAVYGLVNRSGDTGPCTVVKVASDGRVLFKQSLGDQLVYCADLIAAQDGMLYVSGRAPPDPEAGVQVHILQLDTAGKITNTLLLPEAFTIESAPCLGWSKGHLVGFGEGPVKSGGMELFLAEINL